MRRFFRQPLAIALLLILVLAGLFRAWRTGRFNGSNVGNTTSTVNQIVVTSGSKLTTKTLTKTYAKKSTTPSLAVDVRAAHSLIYRSTWVATAGWSRLPNHVPGYLAASQWLLATDVVVYLENASDKEAAVDTLVGQLEYYRNAGEWHLSTLQSIIQEQTAEYNRCTKEKASADANFYATLREGDALGVDQAIVDAQNAAVCQSRARVVVNANKAMLKRTQAVYVAMGSLTSILQNNRSDIINHFGLFRSNQLEKLIVLRNTLKNQRFTTVE